MKKIWWRYRLGAETKMDNIDSLHIEVDVDAKVEKLEKIKTLLIEIKSLADDIFNKQVRS